MINMTERAAAQVRRMMAESRLDERSTGIRVGVKPAGCSGMAYTLDFETQARDGDQVLEQHGIKIYLDPASAPYLEGTSVDWKGGLLESGFRFVNPQAARTCGCGESFSV
jgi:iron-sulfur cluster assembly protein